MLCLPQCECLAPTILVLFLVLINLSLAQVCKYNEHSAANASLTFTIPAFQPFSTGRWLLSTALNQRQNAASFNYFMEQSFYLTTVPAITTPPAEIPYTGCAILLRGFKSPPKSTGTNGTNSCEGVFDAACQAAISSSINTQLLQGSPQTNPNICQSILASPPKECKDSAWSVVSSTQPFGNPAYSASINSSCPSSIWNGTSDLIRVQSDVAPLNDNTIYDQWVQQATPLVLVAFTKNVTAETPKWGNSTIVCMTPSSINNKSRKPSSGNMLQRNAALWIIVSGAWVMFTRCL
ncbi:hypothetical protein BJ875DRAFT_295030 [Amylocarpus encephaloides]|uniref:Uncharacterized protein n=1 Tax=Amylocarpus encephaloides TaxID=45428 RepID=A0A9P7YJ25_9HELO|nr:hypothetical protein BJ875DRAFT_295030 [Amylocarpus encephaloides]